MEKKKYTKYWKAYIQDISFADACDMFTKKTIMVGGVLFIVDSIKIACGDHVINSECISTLDYEKFSLAEINSSKWSVFIPDDTNEKRVQEIRQLVKESGCLGPAGVNHNKIDHMSLDDIWKKISEKYAWTDRNLYDLIRLFIRYNMYKKERNNIEL